MLFHIAKSRNIIVGYLLKIKNKKLMTQQKTLPIKIAINTHYLKDQSDPAHHKYIWSYEITICNESEEIIQLLNRYWRITDMSGKIEEVRGAGVIGLQPIIKPGQTFTYTSYCQLYTPQGTMEGHYEVQNLIDEYFAVEIPKFVLSAPALLTKAARSRLH